MLVWSLQKVPSHSTLCLQTKIHPRVRRVPLAFPWFCRREERTRPVGYAQPARTVRPSLRQYCQVISDTVARIGLFSTVCHQFLRDSHLFADKILPLHLRGQTLWSPVLSLQKWFPWSLFPNCGLELYGNQNANLKD